MLAQKTDLPIRIATRADAGAIAELHALSWRTAYRGSLSDAYLAGDIVADRLNVWTQRLEAPSANQYVAVLVEAEQLLGFACAQGGYDPQRGTLLENIHVRPELKRQGIGKRLIADVAAWCATERSGEGLYLWVLEANKPARRFYERLGAVNVGSDIWTPPGGGTVSRCRYAWADVDLLHRAAVGAGFLTL
jgi:GNAT superfamily N-acetyltransferase